jgi:tetratricopeptide (TPR) repeat protein
MTDFDVRDVEQRAFALKREGRYAEAADLFQQIVDRIPNWEEGGGAFNLAFCLEETGDLEKAVKCYELALSCDPTNKIFEGNLESLRELMRRNIR